jgi:hypothetical protein
MFLNAHQRLVIPAVLGEVIVFNASDGIALPDMMALMNDSDMDVTLHFDAGNNKAQVTSTVDASGGITFGSTTKTIKFSVDGETAIELTFTTGSRTRAQINTEINAALASAGGNTAKAKAILSGTNFITIVSGTTGQFSSVEFVTPTANSAMATLGFANGVSTSQSSYALDIVSPVTVKSKGVSSIINPRKSAPLLRVRGVVGSGSTGVSVVIDATPLFRYGGVQQ